MKRLVTLLGAIAAGFVGVVTLHGPSGQSVALANVGPTTTTPTTPSSTPGSGPTTTTTTVPVSSVSGTAVGAVENYGYGTMSVKVTVASGHITGLSIASLQTLESYSQQLEQQAVPILKSEVLSAQSTRISALTGATYTSEAYAYSIQSALDKLHYP